MKYLKRFNESIKNDNDEVINKILKFVSTSYFINKSSIFSDNFKPNKVEALNFACNDLDITIHNKGDKQILIIREVGDKNTRNTIVNHVKLKELFYSVLNIYVYKQLINTLVKELKLSKRDIIERVEEFEIIKNNEITGESYLDLISLRSLFDFYNLNYDSSEYIFESVSNKSDIIDELLSYVDTDEFFRRTQIYIDRESGEVEVSFMYDNKNIIVSQRDLYKEKQTYAIFVNYKEIHYPINTYFQNIAKLELLYNKVYKLSHDPNYIAYRRLIRTLREFLVVEYPEVEERVEEFSIFENNTVDFLSMKSLFEFYKKPYNESVLKQLLKIKETGGNTHNINESTKVNTIDDLISHINSDDFFKYTKIYKRTHLESLDSDRRYRYTDYSFRYNGIHINIESNIIRIDHNIIYDGIKVAEIFNSIVNLYDSNEYKSYRRLVAHLESMLGTTIGVNEVEERLDEFDVIKNKQIDFISLESLYEFLNIWYNETEETYIKENIIKDPL